MRNIHANFLVFALMAFFLQACNSADTDKKYFQRDGVALDGYDPVAYFTAEKAVPGKADFSQDYEGATYYFSSQENLETFSSEPEKYVPQYGGWCAYAITLENKMAPDPETFKVTDGKLYLFYNSWGNNTLKKWNQDEETLSKKADEVWARLAARSE